MWELLRRHQLEGLKFKRQHRIRNFIVDFYCDEKNLIIELEGKIHLKPDQRELDEGRFQQLEYL